MPTTQPETKTDFAVKHAPIGFYWVYTFAGAIIHRKTPGELFGRNGYSAPPGLIDAGHVQLESLE